MANIKESLCVHLDQLQGGETQEIEFNVSPEFLDVQENDGFLAKHPVQIEGQAYIAEDYLVLDFNIETAITLACALCNTEFELPVELHHFLHEEALKDIKKKKFNFSDVVREAIILEIPFYPLCGGKECLHRGEIEKYLKKENIEETHSPFADLE
jgi:uncharacterized metal-binding protein YceD (DUF177 family)